MFISLYAYNGEDAVVTLTSLAKAHACTFDMDANYGGAGQRVLARSAGGVQGLVEQQCGRADPIRCCIVARLADLSDNN
eukprot:1620794-Pleurochrysis_carterae.AAC.1